MANARWRKSGVFRQINGLQLHLHLAKCTFMHIEHTDTDRYSHWIRLRAVCTGSVRRWCWTARTAHVRTRQTCPSCQLSVRTPPELQSSDAAIRSLKKRQLFVCSACWLIVTKRSRWNKVPMLDEVGIHVLSRFAPPKWGMLLMGGMISCGEMCGENLPAQCLEMLVCVCVCVRERKKQEWSVSLTYPEFPGHFAKSMFVTVPVLVELLRPILSSLYHLEQHWKQKKITSTKS